MGTGKSRSVAASAALAAGLGWVEWRTWRASREFLPAGAPRADHVVPGECVVVLGCPMPALQAWRVRIAVRSTDPTTARFVFAGAAVRTHESEARMMAGFAMHAMGVPESNVVIEDRSRTTVENIVNCAPLMADSPAIKIASDTFHARRARRILHDRHPELAQRLVGARDYRPFEWGPLHALLLAFEGYRAYRARSRDDGDTLVTEMEHRR